MQEPTFMLIAKLLQIFIPYTYILLKHFFLQSGSKINGSIQFKALAKLVFHPVMPVLGNCPLCFIHTVRFIQIRCKTIPATMLRSFKK